MMRGVSVLDLVGSKPLQTGSVGAPGSVGTGGDTRLIVEIYALGRGITIEAQRSNLGCTEGSFELEAFGKFYTFEPMASVQAQGLVLPVKRKVPAIRLSLETVDQEQVAKLKSHSKDSLKTVIVSMRGGTGKTTLATEMARHFGCTSIVDEWATAKPLVAGALHLTNETILPPIRMERVQ